MNNEHITPHFFSRLSGILLHPTSLPSPYGIGDLGAEAYHFIDDLQAAGQHLWQVLPLTHTGSSNSPYQSFSAFAGQPLLINLEHLQQLHLITEEELTSHPDVADPTEVSYQAVIPWKYQLLRIASERFLERNDPKLRQEFDLFFRENEYWLADYSLFMACRDLHDQQRWQEWPKPYSHPSDSDKRHFREELWRDIWYYEFMQFFFFKEWMAVKSYANERGIQIIGDIPIFVGMDSADIWDHRNLFQLDDKGYPLALGGVPPDQFCPDGQLWNNPVYAWDAHKKDHYAWWISRIRNQLQLFDVIRVDHFRGFEAYWSVPYGEKSAINGSWVPGPGKAFFHAIQAALGPDLPFIAEDLGFMTPDVEAIRNAFHFPGMKILQFAFDSDSHNPSLPHMYPSCNCICYTGTHDNDTVAGWYASAPDCEREWALQYLFSDGRRIHMDFIRMCMASTATYAIFPLQDVLGLGSEARMNVPGQAEDNWKWRMRSGAFSEELQRELKKMTTLYGRD